MRRDFFDCMTQFHQRLCPPITLSPISQCVSLLRTPMSKHYSELCTANNTALSAAGKMLAQIQDQAATIRKLEAVFRQLHETTTTLNAKSAIYQKDLLENQRQVNYLKVKRHALCLTITILGSIYYSSA